MFGGGGPSFAEEKGAKVTTVYVERHMKAYAIHEYEIDSIGTHNALATIFFSVGSAAFALGTGIIVNACFTEKLTPAGELLEKFISPLTFIAFAVFIGLGFWSLGKRTKVWTRIRVEAA
jgi:hypothetical protein